MGLFAGNNAEFNLKIQIYRETRKKLTVFRYFIFNFRSTLCGSPVRFHLRKNPGYATPNACILSNNSFLSFSNYLLKIIFANHNGGYKFKILN